MATLSITKYSNKVWKFIASDVPADFSFSKLQVDTDGDRFVIVSQGGATTNSYQLADITVYASEGGTPETGWLSIEDLLLRLEELNFPAWNESGAVLDFNLRVQEEGETVISNVNKLIFDGATVVNNGDDSVTITITGGGGGVTEFIELTDVPASYTGQGSKVVAVKADETGLEFVAGGGTTPNLEEVLTEGNTTTKDIEFQEDTISYIPRRIFSNNTEYGDTTFEIFINDPDGGSLYGLSHKDNTTGALSFVRLRKDLLTLFCSDGVGTDTGFDISLDNIKVIGNVGDKGLVGLIDFSADYDNLTYVQKIYVDNAIAGVTVPDATPTVKGIAKLYTSLGSNTDGAVDQNTVNTALNAKQNKEDFIQLASSHALTSTTALQSLTGTAHNVVAGTYRFYCRYTLSGLATSGNCQFGLLGTAPVTVIGWTSNGAKQNTFPNTNQIAYGNVTSAIGVTGASAGISCVMTIEGEVTFSGSGTFIPAVGFGTSPTTGVTDAGSYTSLIKIS
jgi:hypothetical protein